MTVLSGTAVPDDDGATAVFAPVSPPPSNSTTGAGATFLPEVRGNRDDRPTFAPFVPPDHAATVHSDDAATTFGEAPVRAQGDSGPLTIGQAFGSRYHILKLLGIGGMGAVYQAWDAELGVAVAIKVIRPDVMADPHAAAEIERRFKRELLLARQVTHKNVVRIHDLGEIGGIKYITMPYVDGADLSTVQKRDGRLPVSRVLRIARSVVGGLVEAHKAGVVHRDLKPANIMIGPDDEAMIMDFGIARSTGSPTAGVVPGSDTIVRNLKGTATNLDSTVYGAVVGTVEYMAPEQAKGQPVDQRADVYAFGLILYDLLTGQRRGAQAANPIVELQARMKQAPPPVKSIVPAVPDHVDQIVSRCLDPDLDKRFQTSEELAAALALLDDEGVPIPIPPRFSKKLIAASGTVVIALVSATWYLTKTPPPPKKHDPVTVLIADFQNNTNESDFDHTLEPMLRRALESAPFISAYDRNRISGTFGVRPPERLDELAARELALKQGVGVVVSGAIDRGGSGYQVSVKAAETVTGKVVDMATSKPAGKDQVVGAATKLVTTIRKALGDETSDSAQLLAMRSLSTTSMAVAGHYAAALEAQSNGKMEEARASYQKAVELDASFGLGYQGLAIMSRNLGKLEDASKYTTEALKHLDGMTDRERLAVRASYYYVTGDFQQCEKEYGELIAQFAADAVGHNNRALCLSKLRNMREAADELRQSIQILPKRVTLRANLAMLGNYAGDFEAAERELKELPEQTDYSTMAMAFTQLGQGRIAEATDTYTKLAAMTVRGASWSASGTGDLALYEGRYSDAIRTLEQGAASDLAAKSPDRAARKLTSVAYVHVLKGQKSQAIAAADKALTYSKAVPVRFLAARVYVEAGAVAKARAIADGLSAELPAEPHAYGKIIEGELALKGGDAREAVKILTEANELLDTWLGHFDLGRAYLELKAYLQGDSEFERCIKRRGEALALLVDEEPTYGYFPPVYYYQGLLKQGQQSAKAGDSFREYLNIRGKSTEDPLLPDVRKRVGN